MTTATEVYAGTVTEKLLPTPLMELEPMPEFGVLAPGEKLALPKVYLVPLVESEAPETLTETLVLLLGSSLMRTMLTCPSERRTVWARSSELDELVETSRSPGRATMESNCTPYHGPSGVFED